MSANNSEDPPLYLNVGTEVSAKFKGAFCEAKIKRIDKLVRCNLKLKHNNEQITVYDSAIRSSQGFFLSCSDFKLGSTVYVSKTHKDDSLTPLVASDQLHAATLNKILDQSVYTVVFNDGDEKTMKRSFIRFKGEKHYLDSETLNNAPLNNPEHFLYPIKGGSSSTSELNDLIKSKPNLTDNDSDAESLCIIKKGFNNRRESNYSTLTEDVTIKSELKSEIGDQDDLLGNESDNASTCSSSSDDFPAEEKDRFVAQLFKFMDDRATPMNKVPAINKVDLDLHKFFITVKKFGGFNRVSKQRSWLDVYKKLGLPNVNSSNVLNLKSAYKRYLQAFEDFYRKLGSTTGMCDLVALRTSSGNTSKRSTNTDHRQLFKSRYLTPTTTSKKTTAASSSSASTKNKQKKSTATTTTTTTTTTTNTTTTKTEVDSSASNLTLTSTDPILSTPFQPKRDRSSLDELNQNSELTIESIANSNLFSSSVASSGGSMIDDQQLQSEELTLFSIAKTFTEDNKKAKKKRKKKKRKKILTRSRGGDNRSQDRVKCSAANDIIGRSEFRWKTKEKTFNECGQR
jgi:hypothetical protein